MRLSTLVLVVETATIALGVRRLRQQRQLPASAPHVGLAPAADQEQPLMDSLSSLEAERDEIGGVDDKVDLPAPADKAATDELSRLVKEHAIAFGRLETRALAAVEETVSRGQARESALQDRLESALGQLRGARDEITLMKRRMHTLEESLADRDRRQAELMREIAELRRRPE